MQPSLLGVEVEGCARTPGQERAGVRARVPPQPLDPLLSCWNRLDHPRCRTQCRLSPAPVPCIWGIQGQSEHGFCAHGAVVQPLGCSLPPLLPCIAEWTTPTSLGPQNPHSRLPCACWLMCRRRQGPADGQGFWGSSNSGWRLRHNVNS